MKFRQQCPNCSKAVPLKKTQWSLGTPFACAKCGTAMVIEKNFWIPLIAIVAFFRFKGDVSGVVEIAGLILAIAVVVYGLSVLFMQPQLVKRT